MVGELRAVLSIVAPRLNYALWAKPLDDAFAKFGFTSPARVAAAMGQFLVEAGPAFSGIVENLNYTSASRLATVYRSHFPSEGWAQPYVGKPEALANLVYAGRNGNGDAESGDGWLFRGRGLIQITGRSAYMAFATAAGVELAAVTAWCETPAGAAMSGAWFLATNGCLELADAWEINAITRRVNGAGMEGAGERLTYANYIRKALET